MGKNWPTSAGNSACKSCRCYCPRRFRRSGFSMSFLTYLIGCERRSFKKSWSRPSCLILLWRSKCKVCGSHYMFCVERFNHTQFHTELPQGPGEALRRTTRTALSLALELSAVSTPRRLSALAIPLTGREQNAFPSYTCVMFCFCIRCRSELAAPLVQSRTTRKLSASTRLVPW